MGHCSDVLGLAPGGSTAAVRVTVTCVNDAPVINDGDLTLDAASITVNNVDPVVDPITIAVGGSPTSSPVIAKDDSLSASANFSDVGTQDTHTAVWDWGDGSTSAGTVGAGVVGPDSHTYTEPGVYTVALLVTDDDGGTGESFFQFVVVYDPNGGFVTGGGWIDSPPGAYAADPSLTGK
ncbi:MAG: PKD domain-containing protein, partial [Anaerolineae bacterium]|nr:PKD domain-containing protein [Anaerolineae bacterium]